MDNLHLLDTEMLMEMLLAYTSEYNKRLSAGDKKELIDPLKENINQLQKIIELRKHNPKIPRTDIDADDDLIGKN